MHEMWVAVALLCCWFGAGIEAQGDVRSKLSTQFYQRTCPGVEQVVASTMFRHLQQDITSGAPLLRMFFHDCAVNVRHNSPPLIASDCEILVSTHARSMPGM